MRGWLGLSLALAYDHRPSDARLGFPVKQLQPRSRSSPAVARNKRPTVSPIHTSIHNGTTAWTGGTAGWKARQRDDETSDKGARALGTEDQQFLGPLSASPSIFPISSCHFAIPHRIPYMLQALGANDRRYCCTASRSQVHAVFRSCPRQARTTPVASRQGECVSHHFCVTVSSSLFQIGRAHV